MTDVVYAQDIINAVPKVRQSLHESKNFDFTFKRIDELRESLYKLDSVGKGNIRNVPDDQLKAIYDVLELGAEVSILSEDFKSFEKFYKQLQPYYDPLLTNTSALYSSEQATQSRNLMTGLYLMYLFTTFQFGDFEKEHESLDDKRKDNVFVDYVIRLRRDMEEKAYFQFGDEMGDIPHPLFSTFLNHIKSHIVDDVADTVESAYNSMSVQELCQSLSFSSVAELRAYISSQERTWEVDEMRNLVVFSKPAQHEKNVNFWEVFDRSLNYARKSEQID